jgi:UDP-glucose 4-epimerase
MKKACVIGGAGFIGSFVVDQLIEKGFDVCVIDDLSTGSKTNLKHRINFYKTDIKNKKAVEDIFNIEKPDYVYLLAAKINVRESIKDPIDDAMTNIIGCLNVCEACVKYKIKKIIFSSTGGAIYGEDAIIPTPESEKEKPLSPYGVAKLSIEKYLDFYKSVHKLDYTILRYSNVYGPRQNSKGEGGVISIFINNILNNKVSNIFGDGEQTRDFIYVKDVAQANLLALDLSGIFNVGSKTEITINNLYQKIKTLIGSDIEPEFTKGISGEIKRSCLDNQKIIKEIGENQYYLEEGLLQTIDYFKNIS